MKESSSNGSTCALAPRNLSKLLTTNSPYDEPSDHAKVLDPGENTSCQDQRGLRGFGEERGKKVTVGEDDNCHQYEVFLPGYHEEGSEDEDGARAYADFQTSGVNPCTGELELEEKDLYDRQRLAIECGSYEALCYQVDFLISLGFEDLKGISMKDELVGCDRKMLNKAENHILRQNGKSFVYQDVEKVQRMREVAKQTILDMKSSAGGILNQIKDLGIETTKLSEIKDALEKLIRKNQKKLMKSVLFSPCCDLFARYPAPSSMPTPISPEFLSRLQIYQKSKNFKELWKIHSRRLGCHMEFPRMLQLRMDQLIHAFPNGVAASVYWDEFTRLYGYEPDYQMYGMKHLDQIISLNIDEVFHISETPPILGCGIIVPTIMFPVCRHKTLNTTALEVMRQYYHSLKVLLAQHKYLELEETYGIVQKELPALSEFKPEDWELCDSEFVECCIERISEYDDSLTIYTVTKNEANDEIPPEIHYVCINSFKVIKELNLKHGIVEQEMSISVSSIDEAQSCKANPKNTQLLEFFNNQAKMSRTLAASLSQFSNLSGGYMEDCCKEMDALSNYVSPNSILECEITLFFNPDDFIISLTCYKAKMVHFFNMLLIEHLRRVGVPYSHNETFTPDRFRLNQYVLAYQKLYSHSEPQWFRGRIVSIMAYNKFEIYFVDHGCRLLVDFKYIRMMPYSVFTLSQAFAIPCRLRNGFNNITSYKWSDEESQVMKELVREKDLLAVFHTSRLDDNIATQRWEVSLKYNASGRWLNLVEEVRKKIDGCCDIEEQGHSQKSEDDDASIDWLAYYMASDSSQ